MTLRDEDVLKAGLPLLEKVRVLAADVERRRLAVANNIPSTSATGVATSNLSASVAAAASGSTGGAVAALESVQHENVGIVRDHWILSQSDAVRRASSELLDLLDGEELAALADRFLKQARLTQTERMYAAQRAVDAFEMEAAAVREYHRSHPQRPFSLPHVERPGDRDVHHVRSTLFTAAERRGRAVDLTLAFRRLTEFLELSAADEAEGSVGLVVHRDIGVEYDAFVLDPIAQCARIAPARKMGSRAALYRGCLEAAVAAIEQFVSKTKPLVADAELADARSKYDAVLAQAQRGSTPQLQLQGMSTKVRDAWKEYVAAAAAAASPASMSVAPASVRALAKMLAAASVDLRRHIGETAALEERVALLCENCVGDAVLAASAEHIRRSRTRNAAEQEQDEEDDETKFQQDFFLAFYSKRPLSDRVELTITGTDDLAHAHDEPGGSATAAAGAAVARRLKNTTLGVGVDDDGDADAAAAEAAAEEERLRNPKNFPLDALGQPIPAWLWKLHQLGKKFHCEICGVAYEGEKIYTQHFAEPRHERGLERLGIKITPQTAAQFRLVPTREGALRTQRRIEEGEAAQRRRLRGDDEEVEDARGNVMTRAQLRGL